MSFLPHFTGVDVRLSIIGSDKKKKEADALQKAHDDFMKQLTEASRRRSLMNRLHRGVGPNQFLYDI